LKRLRGEGTTLIVVLLEPRHLLASSTSTTSTSASTILAASLAVKLAGFVAEDAHVREDEEEEVGGGTHEGDGNRNLHLRC
jgi:hypothetical protein